MVGRDVVERQQTGETHCGDVILRADRLTREGVFIDISFEVRSGEIVALAGLVGSGRSEVARAIFGIDRYDAGAVYVAGVRLKRALRQPPWPQELGSCPRTGACRASLWNCRSKATLPWRRSAVCSGSAS